jgi:hypothetical protein
MLCSLLRVPFPVDSVLELPFHGWIEGTLRRAAFLASRNGGFRPLFLRVFFRGGSRVVAVTGV